MPPRPRDLDDVLVSRVVSEIHGVLMHEVGKGDAMRLRRLLAEIGPPLVGILGVLVVWALVAAATDTAAIPTPAAVWSAFINGMRDGIDPGGRHPNPRPARVLVRRRGGVRRGAWPGARAQRVRAPSDPPTRRCAPDHSVRGVGPACSDLVRRHGARRGVRRDRRLVPGDDARDAAGDPPSSTALRARRAHPRRHRVVAVPDGHLSRGTSGRDGRAPASVGVRVEGADGGRADRRHGRHGRARASARRAEATTSRHCSPRSA